jgi:hypothetical protein
MIFMKAIRTTIPDHAKIADVVRQLKTPVEYVRRVLLALNEFGARKDNDDYLVALSLQSDPRAPDYQIIEIMERETGGSMIVGAFSGKTHKPLSYDKAATICWSNSASTFAELQKLIGSLREVGRTP